MKKGLIALIAVVAIVVLIVTAIVGTYNGLVEKQAAVEGKQSNVEADLQRRADLIPNLVSTVKGYAAHEEEVLTAVTNARSAVQSASSFEDMMQANETNWIRR